MGYDQNDQLLQSIIENKSKKFMSAMGSSDPTLKKSSSRLLALRYQEHDIPPLFRLAHCGVSTGLTAA
eukprot:3656361-Amphidinium_carterae.1